MAAEFEIRRSSDGKFYFVLQAENNEIIAVSEMYERKASAQNGIDAVKRIAATAPVNDTTAKRLWVRRRPTLAACRTSSQRGASDNRSAQIAHTRRVRLHQQLGTAGKQCCRRYAAGSTSRIIRGARRSTSKSSACSTT
jgi:uncharacterized protein YegP (UPF0339 family)